MLSVGPLQGFEYISSTQTPGLQIDSMDDLTELFTLPIWPEGLNPMNKFPWDHHSGTSILGHSHYPSHDMLGSAQINQQQAFCDTLVGSMHSSSTNLPSHVNGGSLISQGIQEAAAFDALRRLQGPCQTPGFGMSLSLASGSPCDMGSSISPLQSSTPPLPTWPQPYMGRMSSPTLGLRQAKVEPPTLQDGPQNPALLCGKINQVDHAQAGPNEGMFVPMCGPQARQLTTSSGQQGSHGLSAANPYSSHTGLGQPQGAAAVVAGTARPRVRARRGQATDPHSIAERLRRERIADRMKALQELVPNANKTDKASMLDEIIEYVRFLQMQVKILNMSRLSGTGAVVPFVADISSEGLFDFRGGGAAGCPSQDNMIATERQVARMMEESMGSALQFLQSKGLCLMPISLASAMSISNTRPLTGSSHGKTDASSVSIRTSSNVVMPMSSLHSTGDFVGDDVSSAIQSSKTQPTMVTSFRSGLKPLTDITIANTLPS